MVYSWPPVRRHMHSRGIPRELGEGKNELTSVRLSTRTMNKTNNKPPTDTVSVHSGRSTRSNQLPLAQRLDDPESAFRRLAQGKSARPSSREASESRFGLPPSIGRAGPSTEIQPASSKIDAEDPPAKSAPATNGELEPLPARPTSNTPAIAALPNRLRRRYGDG